MMNKNRFFLKNRLPDISNKKDIFFLESSNWDDYSHRTSFTLYYISSESETINIGPVKITKINLQSEDYNESIGSNSVYRTIIEPEFETLPDNYVSLGQEDRYYKNLKALFSEQQIKSILECLNDLSYCRKFYEVYKNESVILNSLLRSSQAERLLNIGARLALSQDIKKSFSFTYIKKLEGAAKPHRVFFDFPEESQIPFRINLVIGKNGTGRTQILKNIIGSLAGQFKQSVFENKEFEPQRPFFTSIIAVSYSIFDSFIIPKDEKFLTYKYIGLRDGDRALADDKTIENKMLKALKVINAYEKGMIWRNSIRQLISFGRMDFLEENELAFMFNGKLDDREMRAIISQREFLSSGEQLILLIVTELIANINNNSLVLFDEPESHLHPNMMVKMIRVIHDILNQYQSYAIIATHSPIILQEVPSRYVNIFDREGDVPIIRRLEVESFGENLSTLTRLVFETGEVEEGYKVVLKALLNRYTPLQINELFENALSLNSMLYLSSKRKQ